jgi:hypothetical protein
MGAVEQVVHMEAAAPHSARRGAPPHPVT